MSPTWSAEGIRQESTGWRDQWISQRHRAWGWDCAATDIDGIGTQDVLKADTFLEYYHYQPVALFEYKTYGSLEQLGLDKVKRDHEPVKRLATMAGIPSFIVGYDSQAVQFQVHPTNQVAQDFTVGDWRFGDLPRTMSEERYVGLLYRLRGIKMPEDLRNRLAEASYHRTMGDSVEVEND
jgi:hypothetical protein